MSQELAAFKKHFTSNCSVKVVDTVEGRNCPHWKRLVFASLNCEDMDKISKYIKQTFGTEGMYSHILPKLGVYDEQLCLTVDVSQINEKILNK